MDGALQRRCKRHKILKLDEYQGKNDGSIFPFLAMTKNNLTDFSSRALLPHFHPKLNTKYEDLDKVIQRIKFVLGEPLEVSLFRLWEIENPNEGIEGIFCDDNKEYEINPHYGYKHHYVAWFAALGKKELGRVFMTIVKQDGSWKYGFFHFHKWTHLEKDYNAWIANGNKDISNKKDMSAYIKFSIAQKLLEGNPHFQIKKREELDQFIEKNLSKKDWLEKVRQIFPGQTILTADSVFSSTGLGMLLRFEIKKELSTVEIREHCTKQLNELKKLDWFFDIEGTKCSYVVKGEPRDKEGQLGSIYLQKQNI